MVGQLKLAVAQSLQSPGHAQPLLDQPLQLPHRRVGAAIEVQLRARQGEKVKAKCVHAEMAACIRIIFTDDVQACVCYPAPRNGLLRLQRVKQRDNRRILSRESLLRGPQPQYDG